MDEERFRATLRELRKRLVGSQGKLSTRTKTSDDVTPIAVMTISDIETGHIKDPGLFTIARLVEAMPGMSLSKFFMQCEDTATDLSQIVAGGAHDDPFEEERISQETLRWLWRHGFIRAPEQTPTSPLAGSANPRQRPADDQHHSRPRHQAPDVHPPPRKPREHHGDRPSARRSPKK